MTDADHFWLLLQMQVLQLLPYGIHLQVLTCAELFSYAWLHRPTYTFIHLSMNMVIQVYDTFTDSQLEYVVLCTIQLSPN